MNLMLPVLLRSVLLLGKRMPVSVRYNSGDVSDMRSFSVFHLDWYEHQLCNLLIYEGV